MTPVEQVALWAGLISSIVSIVTSVVAIWFAVHVDRGARQVTAQTIKSLQKIESDVERLSTDTRELIKAGWDKMLGSVHALPTPTSPAAKDIAAGIASELRADLAHLSPKAEHLDPSAAMRFNEVLSRLEKTLAGQIHAQSLPERPSALFDQARVALESLSPEARALAMEIPERHVTRQRYLSLAEGPLGPALEELREAGLLVPVRGRDKEGKEVPAYYYPSRLGAALRAVVPLAPAVLPSVRELVKNELKRVGYYEDL